MDALLRRAGMATVTVDRVLVGDLTLDEDSHDVARGGEAITLTNTEFELLRCFMENQMLSSRSRRYLIECGLTTLVARQTSIELYISYLRKKIDAGREHDSHGQGSRLYPSGPPHKDANDSLTPRLRIPDLRRAPKHSAPQTKRKRSRLSLFA